MLQVNHAELAERLTATSQAVASQMPALLTGNPQSVSMVNGLVSQQAAMLSYLDDFFLMMLFSLSAVPGVESLYAAVGFVPDERAMVRRRLF